MSHPLVWNQTSFEIFFQQKISLPIQLNATYTWKPFCFSQLTTTCRLREKNNHPASTTVFQQLYTWVKNSISTCSCSTSSDNIIQVMQAPICCMLLFNSSTSQFINCFSGSKPAAKNLTGTTSVWTQEGLESADTNESNFTSELYSQFLQSWLVRKARFEWHWHWGCNLPPISGADCKLVCKPIEIDNRTSEGGFLILWRYLPVSSIDILRSEPRSPGISYS